MITMEMLRAFAPRPSSIARAAIWDGYASAICDQPELFAEYGVSTPLRLAHLMAQWGHESGGFTILWESGAYTASRIVEIFGVGRHSAAVTMDEAAEIASLSGEAKTEALFERVYGLGNPKKAAELGNVDPGDGAKYRGWGIQQITGRRDHERLIKGEYSYENAVKVALIEWREKGCNRFADADDLRKITKLINGGYNGIADREKRLSLAKREFAGATSSPNGLDRDRKVAEVAPPANDTEPSAPPPTLRDLAEMGSTKAVAVSSAKRRSVWLMITGMFGWAADKVTGLGIADINPTLDHATHALDSVKVIVGFAKDNLLLLLVFGGGAGLYLGHTLGAAMVRDFVEGRYRPRDNVTKEAAE